MPKNNKEHKMSERKKYLRTLMADMGLSSVSELSPEERRRWERAAEPQDAVKKRLKEMGYSLNSDTNKRSLGRLSKIITFNKFASTNPDLDKLKAKIGPDVWRKVALIVLPIFGSFRKSTYVERAVKAINKASPGLGDDPEVQELLINISNSMQRGVYKRMDADDIFRDDPNAIVNIGDLSKGSKKMVVGYLILNNHIESKSASDEELIAAIKSFQTSNSLPPTGTLDKRTYVALSGIDFTKPAKKMAPSKRKGEEGSKPIGPRDISELSNITIGSNVDLDSTTDDVKRFVSILDQIAGELGMAFFLSSAFRTSYNQARIMYNNYESRGIGSYRANNYLSRLYRKFPRIDEIVAVFSSAEKDRDQKIKDVEYIIEESWPASEHRGGVSIDISRASKSDFNKLLDRAEQYADFRRLWEGDHYHITVRGIRQ